MSAVTGTEVHFREQEFVHQLQYRLRSWVFILQALENHRSLLSAGSHDKHRLIQKTETRSGNISQVAVTIAHIPSLKKTKQGKCKEKEGSFPEDSPHTLNCGQLWLLISAEVPIVMQFIAITVTYIWRSVEKYFGHYR